MLMLQLCMLTAALGCKPQHTAEVNEFVCSTNGRHYSVDELVDIAIKDHIRLASLSCSEKYASVSEFKAKNHSCCDLDTTHFNLNEPNDHRWLMGIGNLAGNVRLRYYCGSDKINVGKYVYGFSNITTCGVTTESVQVPAMPEYPDEFPNRK